MTIPILRHTQKSFVAAVETQFGKGGRHAKKLYTEWWKNRWHALPNWVEPQALSLVQRICAAVDHGHYPCIAKKEEESITKFLLRLEDGLETESVMIPRQAGMTLCISSQIGCRMGCTFCETGRMGLIRHLRAEEIVAQVAYVKLKLQCPIRNIVFMGMGEPLDNFEEVMQALRILTDPAGASVGPSRVTISTSGHVEGIYRLIEQADPAIHLAVSVNAPDDAVRQKIMPVNRRWDMQKLKEAMREYCLHPRREIFVEYVLLDGVNSSIQAADALADYLEGLRVRVNLIPYNAQSCDRFAPPPPTVIENFMTRLRTKNYRVLIRRPKGRDIMAACGQLGNPSLRIVRK